MKQTKWTFTEEELKTLNDSVNTISYEEKEKILSAAIQMINTLCLNLNLNDAVHLSICMLFRRFYVDHSMMNFDVSIMIQACILLACKVEESPVRLEKIMNCYNTAFHELPQHDPIRDALTISQTLQKKSTNSVENEYDEDQEKNTETSQILVYERILLSAIDYDINIPNPYHEPLFDTVFYSETISSMILNTFLLAINLEEVKQFVKEILISLKDTDIYLKFSSRSIIVGALNNCLQEILNDQVDLTDYSYGEKEETIKCIFLSSFLSI